MIKKLLKQFIPAYFLFLGIFASCTSDVDPGSPIPASGISLRLQTTRSSVDTGTDLENQIHNIHFWFFASNASGTDKALFYTSELPTSIGSELVFSYTDEVLRLHNMNSQGKYKLLVVANLPADAMNAIGETTTQDELKNYFYSAAASGRPHNPFSMTGCTTGAHDFSIDSEVSISLLRVASRLDVQIVNATGKTLQVDKVSIVNDQQSVQFFAPASDAPVLTSDAFTSAMDIYTTSTIADEVKCSGYVYENRSTTSTDVVIEGSIDGDPAKWTVPIMPDGSTILPRNSVCKATIKLKGITPTDVKFTISEWNKEPIETSFTNTYIDVDKTEIEVIYLQGGVLGVQSNAEFIHIKWDTALGFYLAGYEDVTEATLAISNEHAALTFYFKGLPNTVIPDGTVTITTGNLKKTVNLRKKNSNLIFAPGITLNGHEIHDGDVIPGDLWGSLNEEETFMVSAYTNLTWAYKCTAYSAYAGGNILEFEGRSVFNGTVGNSTIDGALGTVPVFDADSGLDKFLPVQITTTFYLNSSTPPYNGIILYTLHFTIAK